MTIQNTTTLSNFKSFRDFTKHFTGTCQYWDRYSFSPKFLLTDGTRHIAEQCGADWLFQDIAVLQNHQKIKKHPKLQQLQFWELRKNADESAVLKCSWDAERVVYSQNYLYTDFPFDNARIWVAPSETIKDGAVLVAYLPSEH